MYVSYENTSTNFKLIIQCIIHVYARIWFTVKARPYFYQSPIHILNMVINTREINDPHINEIFHKVINNNSYALHSENIIFAMLTDVRDSIRLKAAKYILMYIFVIFV